MPPPAGLAKDYDLSFYSNLKMVNSDHENDPHNRTVTSEQRLAVVTIGERRPHNAPIYLAPYDSEWQAQYWLLADRIRGALGERILLLEHVGSTAVPGLSAKPIIDMVMAVEDSADERSYVPQLERRGFVLRIREEDWYEHRLLKAPAIMGNLHVFSHGCDEIERMLTFRDWLRRNEQDRTLYERTKSVLAARTWQYTQEYADAKTQIVEEILARAQSSSAP